MVSQEWPRFRAIVRRFGPNKQASFSLLRQMLGITPAEALALMRCCNLEVASGGEREVKRTAQCFRDIGATVKVELIGSPPAASLDQALEIRAGYLNPEPVAIEGLLVVCGPSAYLVAHRDAERGILLLEPRIDRKLEKGGATAPVGGLYAYQGRACVEGLIFDASIPMFPKCIRPFIVNYYGERLPASDTGKPIRIECY